MEPLKIGCVLMAAGSARRFGANKLMTSLDGRSLILRALETIPTELLDTVVVVTQYPEIMRLAGAFRFSAIHNPQPDDGISHTIQLGLTGLRDCDGVLFLVSDQPMLTRNSTAMLVELWKQYPNRIAALSHNGIRGNPCLFPARFYPELMALTGDQGGSSIIRHHKEDLILLEVPAQELTDVDTPVAMEALRDKYLR